MDIRTNTKKTANGILCLLLFLACFNFLGRGPVVFFIFSLYAIFVYNRRGFNGRCHLYLLMSITALIASMMFFEFGEWVKALVYFTAFYAGYCIQSNFSNELSKRLVFFAVLGFVAHLVFIGYLNVIVLGHITGDRLMVNPWTGRSIAVTLIGLNACVPMVYSFYCFFCQKKLWLKVFGAIILVLSIWINVETATRSPFLLLGIVYFVMFYELIKSDHSKSKVFKLLLLLSIVLIGLYFVSSRITGSVLGERFEDEGLNTLRWEIMGIYYNHMWEYPLGGNFVQQNYHRMAHNMIQELYDMYGLFFSLFFIIIFIGMIKKIISYHKMKNKEGIALLMEGLYIGIIIYSFLEPVAEGYPQLLWLLFMIDGLSNKILLESSIPNNMVQSIR